MHNDVTNLEYVTPKGNQQHSWIHNNRQPHAKGADVHFAKLTDTQVITIRQLRASGFTYRAIAEQFNTKTANVWHICQGHTWKHLL